jgi:hypothetical protein
MANIFSVGTTQIRVGTESKWQELDKLSDKNAQKPAHVRDV